MANPQKSADPSPARFVSYLRVSTEKQGRSGLGLEAQREAVARFVAGSGGLVIAEHVEVESGKRSDRPQLAAAMATCRATGASLLVAKLDRLSRNVAFLSGIMESKIDFVCADNPHANSVYDPHSSGRRRTRTRDDLDQDQGGARSGEGAGQATREPEPAAWLRCRHRHCTRGPHPAGPRSGHELPPVLHGCPTCRRCRAARGRGCDGGPGHPHAIRSGTLAPEHRAAGRAPRRAAKGARGSGGGGLMARRGE